MADDNCNKIAEKLATICQKSKKTDSFLVQVEKKFTQISVNEEEMTKQMSEAVKEHAGINEKLAMLIDTALPAIKEAVTKLSTKQNELKTGLENSCYLQTRLLSEIELLWSQYFDKDPRQIEHYKNGDKETFLSYINLNAAESGLRDCGEKFDKEYEDVKAAVAGVENFLRDHFVKQIVESFEEDVKKRKPLKFTPKK